MIVCVCHAVSEKQLRAVVGRGACTLEEVERACGAGGDCGTCQPEIVALLRKSAPPIHEGTPTEAGGACSWPRRWSERAGDYWAAARTGGLGAGGEGRPLGVTKESVVV